MKPSAVLDFQRKNRLCNQPFPYKFVFEKYIVFIEDRGRRDKVNNLGITNSIIFIASA